MRHQAGETGGRGGTGEGGLAIKTDQKTNSSQTDRTAETDGLLVLSLSASQYYPLNDTSYLRPDVCPWTGGVVCD